MVHFGTTLLCSYFRKFVENGTKRCFPWYKHSETRACILHSAHFSMKFLKITCVRCHKRQVLWSSVPCCLFCSFKRSGIYVTVALPQRIQHFHSANVTEKSGSNLAIQNLGFMLLEPLSNRFPEQLQLLKHQGYYFQGDILLLRAQLGEF